MEIWARIQSRLHRIRLLPVDVLKIGWCAPALEERRVGKVAAAGRGEWAPGAPGARVSAGRLRGCSAGPGWMVLRQDLKPDQTRVQSARKF